MKRKGPEIVNKTNNDTQYDQLMVGGQSKAGRSDHVDYATSEDENMIDNSIDSESVLNEKLRAMKLFEPTLDDKDDFEQDRREFEETYKNL